MVNYNLIQEIGVSDDEVEALIREGLGEQVAAGNMDGLLKQDIENFQRGAILNGRVVGKAGDDVVIDVGLKSEGLINKTEFDDYDALEIGETFYPSRLSDELHNYAGVLGVQLVTPVVPLAVQADEMVQPGVVSVALA